MEKEKKNCKSISRIIQQKNNLGGTYIVDNRSDNNQNYLSGSQFQRICDEEEDYLQGKFDTPVKKVEDEDETLQGKFYGSLPKKNETGMPDNLKVGIESLSGFSMDDVRVHYNSSKPATVQALAYTQGTDIHVAPGQEKHLPHEAWHVAQQMAGRVSPTTNINNMPVNDNAALEHEADLMGEKAVQFKMQYSNNERSIFASNTCVLQCFNPSNGENGRKPFQPSHHEKNQSTSSQRVIIVGVSYRTDGYGENAVNYDWAAIDAVNALFSPEDNIRIVPVPLPRNIELEKSKKKNIWHGNTEIERKFDESDLDDIDMLYIPGNPHALTSQIDDAASTHSADSKKMTSEIDHRFNPGLVSGSDKINYGRKNREYEDRSTYEQRLITLARYRGIPILGVCGGSWQLYNNFGGTTVLFNSEQYQKHAKKISENEAHPVTAERGTMLAGIMGTNQISVNSTHWASVKPLEKEYGDEQKKELELLRREKLDGMADLERMARMADLESDLERMTVLKEMIDISSYEKSSDGNESPESFETKYGVPMMGIQWHPETFLPGMDGYNALYQRCLNDGCLLLESLFGGVAGEYCDDRIHSSIEIFKFMVRAAIARQIKMEIFSRKKTLNHNIFQRNNCLPTAILGRHLDDQEAERLRVSLDVLGYGRVGDFLYDDLGVVQTIVSLFPIRDQIIEFITENGTVNIRYLVSNGTVQAYAPDVNIGIVLPKIVIRNIGNYHFVRET